MRLEYSVRFNNSMSFDGHDQPTYPDLTIVMRLVILKCVTFLFRKRLTMSKSHNVIMIIDLMTESGRGLMRGVTRYSRMHGPWTFYVEKGWIRGSNAPKFDEWGDGLVYYTYNYPPKKAIAAYRFPVIMSTQDLNHRLYEMPEIICDNSRIGKMAAEHLLDCAFKNFAYCSSDYRLWSKERAESFSKRITEAGYETMFFRLSKRRSHFTWKDEQSFTIDWLRSLPKPVGIMACFDYRAEYLVEACHVAELRIPDDVAIIGVDNDEFICESTNPPLSSIKLDFETAGYETAELLDNLMSGKKVKNQLVTVKPVRLISRQSTDVFAIEDQDLCLALKFIREHSREPIQVTDVAQATGTSRQILYKKFQRHLGKTIHQKIVEARIEQIAQLLIETNAGLAHIALTTGFSGPEHIARYFKKAKGITPGKYRKEFGTE